jgi:hypothetical protein
MVGTDLITLHLNALLLDIHPKHLFDITISDCFLPHAAGDSSYAPSNYLISNRLDRNTSITRDEEDNMTTHQ